MEKVEKEYQSSEVSDSHLYRFKDESHGGEYLLNLAKSALAKGYTPSQILNFRFFTRDSEITFRELLEQQRFRLVITTDGGFPLMRYQQYSSIGYPQFVDQDSYQFLLLLMKLTPSSEWKKPWNGFTKQNLSIDHILKKVEEAYKNDEFYSGEHDVFHFTEVLLTYSQGSGKDPNQLKKRFLERETKKTIKSNNVTKIAHQMESLGLLLNAPEITWTQEEQKQVQDWIAKVNQWTARANLTELFDSEVIHLYKGYTLIQKSPHAWAKK